MNLKKATTIIFKVHYFIFTLKYKYIHANLIHQPHHQHQHQNACSALHDASLSCAEFFPSLHLGASGDQSALFLR